MVLQRLLSGKRASSLAELESRLDQFDYDLHQYEQQAQRDPQGMLNYLKTHAFRQILPLSLASFADRLEKTAYEDVRAWTLVQLQTTHETPHPIAAHAVQPPE